MHDRTGAEPLLARMAPQGDEKRGFMCVDEHAKVFQNLKGGCNAVNEPLEICLTIKVPGLQDVICKESQHGLHPCSAGGLLNFV